MIKNILTIIVSLFASAACLSQQENITTSWSISVLPPSVRLDPVTSKVIEERFSPVNTGLSEKGNLLVKNWVYDGKRAVLKSARGEIRFFSVGDHQQ
jgi:hypothetical protein